MKKFYGDLETKSLPEGEKRERAGPTSPAFLFLDLSPRIFRADQKILKIQHRKSAEICGSIFK